MARMPPMAPTTTRAAARQPRFIADCMLGRLAKWLRVLGYDVAYERAIADEAIIARAWREKRVLLTRDTALAGRRILKRTGARFVLVQSNDPDEQLEQVLRDLRLEAARRRLLSRCLRCNERTLRVERRDVETLVPPYVLATQRRFSRCPSCRRVYWRATHVDRIVARLTSRAAAP